MCGILNRLNRHSNHPLVRKYSDQQISSYQLYKTNSMLIAQRSKLHTTLNYHKLTIIFICFDYNNFYIFFLFLI